MPKCGLWHGLCGALGHNVLDDRNHSGKGPVLLSAKGGHWHNVQTLETLFGLPEYNLLPSRDLSGMTVLHVSVSPFFQQSDEFRFSVGLGVGRLECLKCMVKNSKFVLDLPLHRKFVQAQDKDGMAFLDTAVAGGYFDVVKWFVLANKAQLGVDPAEMRVARTNSGLNIVHLAAQGGRLKLLQFLDGLGNPRLSLGNLDNGGRNVMHFACMNGHEMVVAWLARKDNNFDVPLQHDEDGSSALDLAIENGHWSIVVWFMIDAFGIQKTLGIGKDI